MRSKMLKIVTLAAVFLLGGSALASDMTKLHINKRTSPKVVNLKINNDRTLVLKGPVMEDNMSALTQQLKDLTNKSNENVFLIINSPGGSVVDGFEFIDTMRAVKARNGSKVYCAIESEAYSMAALIATFCYKTYIQRHAGLMYHEPSYAVKGTASQVFSRVLHMHEEIELMHGDIAKQMGVSRAEYERLIAKEWWITADEAASMGLVDGVLETLYYNAKPPQTNPFSILFGAEGSPDITVNPLRETNAK